MTKPLYSVTNTSITFFYDGEYVTVPLSNKNFNRISYILQYAIEDRYHTLLELASPEKQVNAYLKNHPSVQVKNGAIYYKGEPLHNYLAQYILRMLHEGKEATPWIKFLENLMRNPSYNSRQQLFQFLENHNRPITEDGCFLADKKVRDTGFDIYSNTVHYALGKETRIPREQVDDNPNNICSSGLHVGNYSYVKDFYSGKVFLVKVNPADVVSVPTDYNSTKMRVCAMTPIADITHQYESENTRLAKTTVYQDRNDLDDEYDYPQNDDWTY